MNTPPDAPDAEPLTTGTCNCEAAAADDAKKTFGIRGAVIAGSLGLALSACDSPTPASTRDLGRMTVLYGPAPMLKSTLPAPTSDGAAAPQTPKKKKGE